MTRLIDDLLDVSRINQGKIELRRERVDLAQRARARRSRPAGRCIDERGPRAACCSLPRRADACSTPTATRLAQVFVNLLNNAAKYTDRGGRIELRVRARGRRGRGHGPRQRHRHRRRAAATACSRCSRRSSRRWRARAAGWASACRWSSSWCEMHGGTRRGAQRRRRARAAHSSCACRWLRRRGAGATRRRRLQAPAGRGAAARCASWWPTTTWTRPRRWPCCWR